MDAFLESSKRYRTWRLLFAFGDELHWQWDVERIFVGFEAVAVDIDEYRVVQSGRTLSPPHRPHDFANKLSAMSREDDQMRILREFHVDVMVKLNDVLVGTKHCRMSVAAEGQLVCSTAIDENDHGVDIEPVRTLHFDRCRDFL